MKPLEKIIRKEIRAKGPMRLDRYMALALTHPDHGYYTSQDPLGAGGDFITAPEISQMFGELVGLWMADMWHRMGQPADVIIAEAGPGRGTLMADALRAIRRAAPALAARPVWLIEASPALKKVQETALGDADIHWTDGSDPLPRTSPMLLVANEFLDALPVRQIIMRDGELREHAVDIVDNALTMVDAPLAAAVPDGLPLLNEGEIVEIGPGREDWVEAVAFHIAENGGAALLIDYGHEATAPGDTVQAMKKHAYHPVLEKPGTADLTAHVDFAAVARAGWRDGTSVFGPIGQRQFLLRLGMEARLAQLLKSADGPTANNLTAGFRRLTDPTHMGHLFKVLCLSATANGTPTGYGDDETFSDRT